MSVGAAKLHVCCLTFSLPTRSTKTILYLLFSEHLFCTGFSGFSGCLLFPHFYTKPSDQCRVSVDWPLNFYLFFHLYKFLLLFLVRMANITLTFVVLIHHSRHLVISPLKNTYEFMHIFTYFPKPSLS